MEHRSIVEDYLKKTEGAGLYDFYPDISDRDRWDALSDTLKTNLINAGEEALKEPWTQLLISDFREFTKTGNRVQFEDKYFPRRRKLNKLVMAECVENKGRFLDAILDGLYLILEETTWCLPPHTSYERDAAQETMPDPTRPIIDLFDAESGAEIAVCEYLLRPVFQKISPYISLYVNERLKERIFEPYLNQHFWWMGNGKEPMCNWTVWCTQNVLLCAFTRPTGFFSQDVMRTFLEKAALSCDYFLDEYGDDGGCDEGAQYYTHAGLCLFGCLEVMSGALGKESSFTGVFTDKLIKNVANYIVKMYVGNGYYVNFADCSALPGRRTAREFLFGKATGDEVLASFAAEDFKAESTDQKLISDEINLFYHVCQAFAYDEMAAYKKTESLAEDTFFASVGLMVARDDTYVLAAKAGDNADSHNHNDVGSFTVYKDGKPFVIDLGVGTYTKKTFSDRRYELWTMQSQFHNLPTFIDSDVFDGRVALLGRDSEADNHDEHVYMQYDGEKYAARDVKCLLSGNANSGISSLSMDMAGAYDSPKIKSYKRDISLNKGNYIVVEDEFEADASCIISLMTYEKPIASDDKTHITVENIGKIIIEGGKVSEIQEYPVTDERLALAWKHEVYRVLVKPDARKLKLTIK
ncbi:MAG: heparinase II/III-family protein [Butyrivibrio sp.]|nr:heparinase II/III-family protein [Butyrivibrio sp.]